MQNRTQTSYNDRMPDYLITHSVPDFLIPVDTDTQLLDTSRTIIGARTWRPGPPHFPGEENEEKSDHIRLLGLGSSHSNRMALNSQFPPHLVSIPTEGPVSLDGQTVTSGIRPCRWNEGIRIGTLTRCLCAVHISNSRPISLSPFWLENASVTRTTT